MASVLGREDRYHDFVAFTSTDLVIAARAAVLLDGLVRLHMLDGDVFGGHESYNRYPVIAQTTNAMTIATPAITNATSPRCATLPRRGFIPIGLP